MTVDPAWEAAHAARAWGKYPHPAAVEFIGRYYGMDEKPKGIALDIGAGAGACTWMLAKSGFIVSAVDASQSAVNRVREMSRREKISPQVSAIRYEAAAMQWPVEFYDVVLDVCCLSCIDIPPAWAIIQRAYGWIKPGGRMLSVMAADDCDPAIHGEFKVRQATRAEVEGMFAVFRDVFIGKHTRLTRRGFISEWVVEAQK